MIQSALLVDSPLAFALAAAAAIAADLSEEEAITAARAAAARPQPRFCYSVPPLHIAVTRNSLSANNLTASLHWHSWRFVMEENLYLCKLCAGCPRLLLLLMLIMVLRWTGKCRS